MKSKSQLSTENQKLRAERRELKRENAELRREVRKLARVNGRLKKVADAAGSASGHAAEEYVRAVVKGRKSVGKTAEFDVRSADGRRIEVKSSGLCVVNAMTRRWTWRRPLGNGGEKRFDRLVLVGLRDERHSPLYKDSRRKYVLFDVPRSAVEGLTRHEMIQISTNPAAATCCVAKRLFSRFHVSWRELRDRYGAPR